MQQSTCPDISALGCIVIRLYFSQHQICHSIAILSTIARLNLQCSHSQRMDKIEESDKNIYTQRQKLNTTNFVAILFRARLCEDV